MQTCYVDHGVEMGGCYIHLGVRLVAWPPAILLCHLLDTFWKLLLLQRELCASVFCLLCHCFVMFCHLWITFFESVDILLHLVGVHQLCMFDV